MKAPLNLNEARAISFDIETLGVAANSVCLSIGAVAFNPFIREVVPQESERIHLHLPTFEQITNGRKVDMSTVHWWANQTNAARSELHKSVDQIATTGNAMEAFRIFLLRNKPTHGYWSRGPMDHNIIEDLKPGLIPYYLWRDQRTICDMMPTLHIPRMTAHTEHDAFEDALYQARYIAAVYSTLTEQQDARERLERTFEKDPN